MCFRVTIIRAVGGDKETQREETEANGVGTARVVRFVEGGAIHGGRTQGSPVHGAGGDADGGDGDGENDDGGDGIVGAQQQTILSSVTLLVAAAPLRHWDAVVPHCGCGDAPWMGRFTATRVGRRLILDTPFPLR
jgi:hypothetical protein